LSRQSHPLWFYLFTGMRWSGNNSVCIAMGQGWKAGVQ
jgi:hypothetical protein